MQNVIQYKSWTIETVVGPSYGYCGNSQQKWKKKIFPISCLSIYC